MNMNLLGISVCNTRTQLGVFINGELEKHLSVNNTDLEAIYKTLRELYELIAKNDEPTVFLASVNDPISAQIKAYLESDMGIKPFVIEKDINVAIGRQLDPESLIGADRLLNAASAYDTLKEAVIILDAGTTVTVDFVDGEGTFHGGAILPGAQLMLNSMTQNTALLPDIQFSIPDDTVGHNTTQAMLSGVFHGIRGAIRELVEKYAEIYMAYPRVIATGGNANALFEDYALVEKIVPELTLLGMAVTYRLVKKESEDE